MRIKVIMSTMARSGSPDILEERRKAYQAMARPDTEIGVARVEKGSVSIENEYDKSIAVPHILQKVKEAEEEGYDAVFITCFGDPGIAAARELVNIPVIGTFQANAMMASLVSEKFSVVTVLDDVIPALDNLIRIQSLKGRLASIRSVNIPVLELHEDPDGALNKLTDESIKAVKEDGAQSILLGCGGFTGMAEELQNRLKNKGLIIPVLDPGKTALKVTEAAADLKLYNSKSAYPSPRDKERRF